MYKGIFCLVCLFVCSSCGYQATQDAIERQNVLIAQNNQTLRETKEQLAALISRIDQAEIRLKLQTDFMKIMGSDVSMLYKLERTLTWFRAIAIREGLETEYEKAARVKKEKLDKDFHGVMEELDRKPHHRQQPYPNP